VSSVLVALRRLRDDRAPAIGLAILVFVTATVFGLAPRLIDRVGDDALHGTVAAATAFNRNIALLEEQVIPAGQTEPLEEVDSEGDALDRRIPAAIRAIVHRRDVVIDSERFEVQAKTQDPSFIRFRIQPGAADRMTIVQGAAPVAAHELVELPEELTRYLPRDETRQPGDVVKVVVLQSAISTKAAREID
jgi:hypothetical protein